MTNEQILRKAIQKAVKEGYDGMAVGQYFILDNEIAEMGDLKQQSLPIGYYSVIFSHDFARAFWPLYRRHRIEETHQAFPEHNEETIFDDWEYHLMKMVLEKEPLKYLEKFIDPYNE